MKAYTKREKKGCQLCRDKVSKKTTRQAAKFEATVDRIIEEYRDVLDALAHGVKCPRCGEVAHPPLSNLGAEYDWAEGHPNCKKKGT